MASAAAMGGDSPLVKVGRNLGFGVRGSLNSELLAQSCRSFGVRALAVSDFKLHLRFNAQAGICAWV